MVLKLYNNIHHDAILWSKSIGLKIYSDIIDRVTQVSYQSYPTLGIYSPRAKNLSRNTLISTIYLKYLKQTVDTL